MKLVQPLTCDSMWTRCAHSDCMFMQCADRYVIIGPALTNSLITTGN